ncbi:hypothetical protein FO519_007888 [Halicephalobus sp. NKZ332]|nr:hypothetical protein FO519_007888 [Halicephalobus sp. NKZ332]
MSECAIILEPLRPIYYPGDILSGYVFINLPKDKKVNKVTLEADGRASVKFTNKYDKHGSKHSAEKVYLEDHLTIWKKNKFQEERWDTIGNRKYPFSFVIPSDAAPTVECTYGFVRYRLKAELNLSWTLDKSFEVEVKVGVPINLESNPTYTQPQSSEILKSSLFSLSKSVLATVSIPRLVWTIGEVIPVFLDFNNDTSNNISMVEITTIKKEIYTGQAIHEKTCKVTKEFIKKLNPMKFNVNVPASASRDVQINVRVQDDSVTVTDCPIINVDYELEIKIHFKGIFASPLSTTLPVIFSSVPLVRSLLFINSSINDSISSSINNSTNSFINPSIDSSVNNSPNPSIYRSINSPINSTNSSINNSIDTSDCGARSCDSISTNPSTYCTSRFSTCRFHLRFKPKSNDFKLDFESSTSN